MTECGPGILWSVVPIELVLEGLAPEYPKQAEVVVEGRLLQVEPGQDGYGTVVRLVAGQVQDYLDPRFQPGSQLRLPG